MNSNSIVCILNNLGLAQSFVQVDFILYILGCRRARGPRPTQPPESATDNT